MSSTSSASFGCNFAFINGRTTFLGAFEPSGINGIAPMRRDPTKKNEIQKIKSPYVNYFLPINMIHNGKNGMILSNQ